MEETKEIKQNRSITGGEFLVKETAFNDIFIPEEWNEEQKMIAQMCNDFMKSELFPILDKIESMKHPELMPQLLEKAGELGLLGLSVPHHMGEWVWTLNHLC
jgi:alkylation response protein AidB-like acyl-CoA dehydrogenase